MWPGTDPKVNISLCPHDAVPSAMLTPRGIALNGSTTSRFTSSGTRVKLGMSSTIQRRKSTYGSWVVKTEVVKDASYAADEVGVEHVFLFFGAYKESERPREDDAKACLAS